MNEIIETTNKTPIEIALGIDEDGFTTTKKLYSWLELSVQHYSDWCKKNILENEFATENEDYKINSRPKGSLAGRGHTTDYKISATFAKKLSMQTHTEKGEKARNYFIGCEHMLVRLAEQKHKTEIERAKGIAVRQALTKAIQQSGEDERMHKHAYSTYTNVIYKSIFNKNAQQLREEYGITKKDNLRDYFSEEELKQVQNAEMFVSSLMGYGWGYDEIKAAILDKGLNKISA